MFVMGNIFGEIEFALVRKLGLFWGQHFAK